MENKMQARMDLIDQLAKGDEAYTRMFREMAEVERKYFAVLGTLPAGQQDAVCDFVSLCEEMSLRKLEIACTHMKFWL